MTPGTAVTVGTTYALTVKADVVGTLRAFVSATPVNDPNGGVAWWYSKRYHAGGFVARGVFTSSPADYTEGHCAQSLRKRLHRWISTLMFCPAPPAVRIMSKATNATMPCVAPPTGAVA